MGDHRPQGQPRVKGRRPYVHVAKVTQEQEDQLVTRAQARGVTIARLMVDSALAVPAVTNHAVIRELAGVRRILTTELTHLGQLDAGTDPGLVAAALQSIQWRDQQLQTQYGWAP